MVIRHGIIGRNVLKTSRKLKATEKERFFRAVSNIVLYHFSQIVFRDFLVKALGGTDALGIKWEDIKPELRKWKEKTKKGIQRINGKVAINVRYGELLAALTPGEMRATQYVPNPGQMVTVSQRGFTYEIEVLNDDEENYAEEVNGVRPFLPEYGFEPWLEEAIERSLPELQTFLRTINAAN